MKHSYSMAEAQAKFPQAVRDAQKDIIHIRQHDETVAFLLSREKMEAILESMEILSNPKAMKSIQDYESGKGKLTPLSAIA